MVELLKDFPDHVIAYKAAGEVGKDEYEAVVIKRIEEVAQKYDMINFLALLETDVESHSFQAFMDYLKISFKHFTKWNRLAVVTNEEWIRVSYIALSSLVHGEIRGYEIQDYDTAKIWVSAPLAIDMQAYYN